MVFLVLGNLTRQEHLHSYAAGHFPERNLLLCTCCQSHVMAQNASLQHNMKN